MALNFLPLLHLISDMAEKVQKKLSFIVHKHKHTVLITYKSTYYFNIY